MVESSYLRSVERDLNSDNTQLSIVRTIFTIFGKTTEKPLEVKELGGQMVRPDVVSSSLITDLKNGSLRVGIRNSIQGLWELKEGVDRETNERFVFLGFKVGLAEALRNADFPKSEYFTDKDKLPKLMVESYEILLKLRGENWHAA